MKKILYTISFIAFLLLIPISVFIFVKGYTLKSNVIDSSPHEMSIVDNHNKSFTVSWKTTDATTGYIVWGSTPQDLSYNNADENSFAKLYLHTSTFIPNFPKFYYKIYSEDKIYGKNNTDIPYSYP